MNEVGICSSKMYINICPQRYLQESWHHMKDQFTYNTLLMTAL